MVESTAQATITARPVYVDPSKIIHPKGIPPILPPLIPPTVPVPIGKRRLILNIETDGFDPLRHRILSIGVQNPDYPLEYPIVIMDPDEKIMLWNLFMLVREMGYNELIGYGLSFDYRFILIKAMKHNLTCKEFYDCDLLDMAQAVAQGKFEFVYYAQKPPTLSELADYLWQYPKAISDLEMIKRYKLGQLDDVYEFTSSQITRILALYILFNNITRRPFEFMLSGVGGLGSYSKATPLPPKESKLTIPEAHVATTDRFKCEVCLAVHDVPEGTAMTECPVCGSKVLKV